MVAKNEESILIPPYGGKLVDLMVPHEQAGDLKAHASGLRSVRLSERATCDLELLATGAFSPLDRFMGKDDYLRTVGEMRLNDGTVFSIPITLPVDHPSSMRLDSEIALRDSRNQLLAVMTVYEAYEWDLNEEEDLVFGTRDTRHPLILEMRRWGSVNISGPLQVLQLPQHQDFTNLRKKPCETRASLAGYGHSNVVAFQTRNPLHRAHEELTKRATETVNGVLLLHPVVGLTKLGDVDHYTRVRTYKALSQSYYEKDRVILSLLPLAMRLAGPREALWHAIIRRNYGANYLIVGRDHASPGLDSSGNPFYGPYDAQEIIAQYSEETGVKPVPFQELKYVPREDRYEEVTALTKNTTTVTLSGTQVREEYLSQGRALPGWFARPEVAKILAESYPPKHRQGVCIWFTGLSGSGKSSTAEVLTVQLMEHGRQVTVLDGDVVRTHLSKGLGFSREDRDTNILRMGFVAAEIVRHGGVAICAAVSPYEIARNEVRNMVGTQRFVEVFVDTPLDVCERRDPKGMYAKARRGEVTGFTGIDDPYEAPDNPEITLDTVQNSARDNASLVLEYLTEQRFVRHLGD